MADLLRARAYPLSRGLLTRDQLSRNQLARDQLARDQLSRDALEDEDDMADLQDA